MPAENGEVKLGDKVRDDVSGVEGIAVGVTTWINGCRRIILQPQAPDKKSKIPDSISIDEPTSTVVKSGVVKGMNTGDSKEDVKRNLRTGGPSPTPRNYTTPLR